MYTYIYILYLSIYFYLYLSKDLGSIPLGLVTPCFLSGLGDQPAGHCVDYLSETEDIFAPAFVG